jgi:tetratricopeptide (TPR) repeat protein
MRFRMARVALGAFFALSGPARADTRPSVWERARDSAASDAYQLHLVVQARMAMRDRVDVLDAQLRTVASMLERHGAEVSGYPYLRFDLGNVYFELDEFDKARRVLDRALTDFPTHPAASQAWLRLAVACGHLGDNKCEKRAYEAALRDATDDASRAMPTLNLAETSMHLGQLREAVAGYREALRLAGHGAARRTAPLAVWGLALVLDRLGEQDSAEQQARFAMTLERSMGMSNLLRTNEVFFVPAYEIHWYEGLGAAARARVAKSPQETFTLWRAAALSFERYVRFASLANDRWLTRAKARLANAQSARDRASRVPGAVVVFEQGEEDSGP